MAVSGTSTNIRVFGFDGELKCLAYNKQRKLILGLREDIFVSNKVLSAQKYNQGD